MRRTSSSSRRRSTSGCVAGGRFDAELVEESLGFAVLRVSGKDAAATFAHESGGHRWQRIPPTERKGRVHTSTVTVAVLAEPRAFELVLRDSELDISTMRGSGAGGQHRNKTDSAVRIRHIPTGVEVRCESERSQSLNKETAMGVLRARIVAARDAAAAGELASDRRRQVGSGMRGDKRRTIRERDDVVNDHETGRQWRFKDYVRGDW